MRIINFITYIIAYTILSCILIYITFLISGVWFIFYDYIEKKFDNIFKLKNRKRKELFDTIIGSSTFIYIFGSLNYYFISDDFEFIRIDGIDGNVLFHWFLYIEIGLIIIELLARIIYRYDVDGYDKNGYDRNGRSRYRNNYINHYTKTKYDRDGYDRNGYDKNGYKRNGQDERGFYKNGIHSITLSERDEKGYNKEGFDKEGFDRAGYDKEGYDEEGFDKKGYNKEGYNEEGYDEEGFDKKGYNRAGYDKEGYNEEGFDKYGFNKKGYNRAGYNEEGYDEEGFDKYGHDKIDMVRFWNSTKYNWEYDYKTKGGLKIKGWEIDEKIEELGNNKDNIQRNIYLHVKDLYGAPLYEGDYFILNNDNKIYYTEYDHKYTKSFVYKEILPSLTPWKETNELQAESFIIIGNERELCDKNKSIMKKYIKSSIKKISKITKDEAENLYNKYKYLWDKKTREKEVNKMQNLKKGVKICSIASGSNGNCYYIGDDNEGILVDNGISYKMLTSRLNEVNIDLNTIKGVFITHEHSDHIKGLGTFYKNNPNIPIYFNNEAFNGVKPEYAYEYEDGVVDINLKTVELGGFKIHPFKKVHDTNFPISYRIEFKGKNIGVFTDIGKVNKEFENQFSKCDAVFLESNHDRQMLRNCKNYPDDLKDRIRKNHLSNDEAYDLIMDHSKKDLKIVILSHISNESNSSNKLNNIFGDLKNKYNIEIASRKEVGKVFEI